MSRLGEILRGLAILAPALALLVWLILYSVKKANDPAQMAFKWAVSIPLFGISLWSVFLIGVPGLFVLVFCAVALSFWWTPHIGGLLARPLTGLYDGGNLAPERRPAYSVAMSRQKRGEYLEAIDEIRGQLERFPNDLEGQMLLAQVLAEDLKNLPEAEAVIQHLCSQSGHAPKNIAFAHYSMADWHLRFAHDRDAARKHFEQVVKQFPDTELALGAAQRIAHLSNPEMPLDPNERKKFVVPEGMRNVGLRLDSPDFHAPERDPAQTASELVRQLQSHPLDTEAREQLAWIYAEHYGMLHLASDQLEQLIQYPNQPAKLVVRWLNMLADIQVRCGAGYDTVRKTLERIIEREPNFAAAETARKRIALLKLELKGKEKAQPVKLGTYEQKLGLKAEHRAGPS